MARNFLEVRGKLRIVANGNFNAARVFWQKAAFTSRRGQSSADACGEPSQEFFGSTTGFDDCNWIKEDGDARVSRRQFNHPRDRRVFDSPQCAQDFLQGFLGGVVESLA